jgi:hypothetical protein
MRFSAALHTYLSVQDVRAVEIQGLRGRRFVERALGALGADAVAGRPDARSPGAADPAAGNPQASKFSVEESPTLALNFGECDRTYLDVPETLLLIEPDARREEAGPRTLPRAGGAGPAAGRGGGREAPDGSPRKEAAHGPESKRSGARPAAGRRARGARALPPRRRATLRIDQSRGFRDTVVWNPHADKARALTDMPDDDWPRMLCVEAAAVGERVELAPGEAWEGSQTLTCL